MFGYLVRAEFVLVREIVILDVCLPFFLVVVVKDQCFEVTLLVGI